MHITVGNLRAGIRSGLPILRAVEEMRCYGVDDPSNGNGSMSEHEILCPWEITQIVPRGREGVGRGGEKDVQVHLYR